MHNLPAAEGAPPVRDSYLVFGSPAIEQEEIDEVLDSLKSGWIGTGPKVKRFEDDFAQYIGCRHAIALNSCTAALHLALLCVGVDKGEEVITSPMTFTATAAAVIHAGGRPVFVDVDPEEMNLDAGRIEAAVTGRTRAVIPVHFAGNPCRMEEILSLTRHHGIRIVEDAAHAIESVAQGRKVGTIGDLTCFSFYVTKNVVTGEGGMITTEDTGMAEKIKTLALHGMTTDAWRRFSDDGFKHYEVAYPGFKYNMTDIQAAMGIHQLARVTAYADRRKEIWARYNEAFSDLPVITPSDPRHPQDYHARHLYTLLLRLDRLKIDRDRFMAALHRENIGTGVHYRALHLHPFYSKTFGYQRGMFPNAEFISDRTVSIPLSAKLTDEDVSDVIEAVRRTILYYAR